jgi:hypothetical protein
MSFVTFDAKAFRKAIRSESRRIREIVTPILNSASSILHSEMVNQVPVDTGKTLKTIKMSKVRKVKTGFIQHVSVGAGDPRQIIGAIEYGTEELPPNGFIRRSADLSEPRMIAIIEAKLGDI